MIWHFLLLTAFMVSVVDGVRCPPEIKVKQLLTVQVPGWSTGSDGAPHHLAGLTFFEGKPEERASLAPDKQTVATGKTVASWTFGANSSTWVACRYAATDVLLTRELPKTIRTCSIVYSTRDTIAGMPVIEKVECK